MMILININTELLLFVHLKCIFEPPQSLALTIITENTDSQ